MARSFGTADIELARKILDQGLYFGSGHITRATDAELIAYAAAVRQKALQAARNACIAELLAEPQEETDHAYDRAVRHCVTAIEGLIKYQVVPVKRQAQS